MCIRKSFSWFLLAGLMVLGSTLHVQAEESATERLRAALDGRDLESFVRELEAGVLDSDMFESDVDVFDVACRSTFPDRGSFLERLLEFGVNPSAKDPEGVRSTFSLLVCAYRENSPTSFEMLLEAGADSAISVCPRCTDSWHTLVAHVLIDPELFDMITERRDLTPVELDSVALYVQKRHIQKSWKGQPVNEYYAAYLRERGYEVMPKGPRTNEERD